ncbi:hypothetical protein V8E54_013672 [Elaphomyces granulatus]
MVHVQLCQKYRIHPLEFFNLQVCQEYQSYCQTEINEAIEELAISVRKAYSDSQSLDNLEDPLELYDGGRKDYNVYTKIYGLHPAIVSTLHDETTIQVLDQYASDTSSKFKEVTDAYEQAFQDFLRALAENNNAPVPLNEPLSELTQCYWKFCDRVKADVVEKSP